MSPLEIEQLKELCVLTVELTKLRQQECKHLCIENFAPELLGKIFHEFLHQISTYDALRAGARE